MARAASVAFILGVASRVPAEPPVLVPCDDPPAAVAALGSSTEIEAYGIAPGASVSVVAMPSTGGGARSELRFARGANEPRVLQLAGRVLGLAVLGDGSVTYAVVRVADRKGAVKSVDLLLVDPTTARATSGVTLPATARGLAIGADGSTLLVASRDEIRTFQLPGLASGRLYRVQGDNVGVAPIAGSSYVVVAQPSRVVLADLAAPQGRDGLALTAETAAPVPFRGLLGSTGDLGPIVLADGGRAFCVRAGELPATPPVSEKAADPAPPPIRAPVPPAPSTIPAPVDAAPRELPAGPGVVVGVLTGPSLADAAMVVFLGPDNVLHEAARAVPDDQGRFTASGLPAGVYRIVASGKGGRVLICDPPFITIRVGIDGAVEAPMLKVLRAQ